MKCTLYFFGQELLKANFIIPMRAMEKFHKRMKRRYEIQKTDSSLILAWRKVQKEQAMMFLQTDYKPVKNLEKTGKDSFSNLMATLASMMSSLMEQENQKQESILQKASLTKLKKLTKDAEVHKDSTV